MSEKKSTLSEMVYDHITEMILRREICCGERIPEQRIVDSLGVSRTPVREAIRKLSGEGVVCVTQNKCAEVIVFTDMQIRDLGVVRMTMDCLAAQLAIQYGSNKDFDELYEISVDCEEARKRGDLYERIKKDCELHMKLVEVGQNDFLYDVQRTILMRTRLLLTDRLSNKKTSHRMHDHFEIIESLKERDAEKVMKTIQDHLSDFYEINCSGLHMPVFQFYDGGSNLLEKYIV